MAEAPGNSPHNDQCSCALCVQKRPFAFPQDLVESFLEGKMTIFAGAGIRTEGANVIGHTLYDEIKKDLEEQPIEDNFPNIISEFCKKPNGRLHFISRLHKRIRNVETSPEFFWYATNFHRALAPAIITLT